MAIIMQSYVGCENLMIKGISVCNHANWNNDEIEIDGNNVPIENCVIDSDMMGFVLKAMIPGC